MQMFVRCIIALAWLLSVASIACADISQVRRAIDNNEDEQALELLAKLPPDPTGEASHLEAIALARIANKRTLEPDQSDDLTVEERAAIQIALSDAIASGYSPAYLDWVLFDNMGEDQLPASAGGRLMEAARAGDLGATNLLFIWYCSGEPLGDVPGQELIGLAHSVAYSQDKWGEYGRSRSIFQVYGQDEGLVAAALAARYASELATGGCFSASPGEARNIFRALAKNESYRTVVKNSIYLVIQQFNDSWGKSSTRATVDPDAALTFEWTRFSLELGLADEFDHMRLANFYAEGEVVERNLAKARSAYLSCFGNQPTGLQNSNELNFEKIYRNSDDVLCFDSGLFEALWSILDNSSNENELETALDFLILISVRPEYEYRARRLADKFYDNATTESDFSIVMLLYEIAAAAGDMGANFRLGYMHSNSQGENANPSKARDYYRAASEAGSTTAKYNLALLYRDGRGGEKDLVSAANFMKQAADEGDVDAIAEYGRMLGAGEGVLENDVEAVKWLRRAANMGQETAQGNLAVHYANGEGVGLDFVQAYKWANLASAQGSDFASNLKTRISQRMNREQINRAQALSASFEVRSEDETWSTYSGSSSNGGRDAYSAPSSNSPEYSRDLVLTVQTGLKSLGFYDGALDGLYGPRTATAISRFQSSNDLTADGEPSAELAVYIGAALGASASNDDFSNAWRDAPVSNDDDSIRSSGSGFLVSSSGDIVTNAHVVTGCSKTTLEDGTILSMQGYDPETDLALLQSSTLSGKPFLRLREGNNISLAEDILVAGFPLSGLVSPSVNVTSGNVSALTGPASTESLFQITAPVQVGNSGGPIVDRDGAVVGVVVSKLDAISVASVTGDIPQNVNFGISLSALKAFLDARGVNYQQPTGVFRNARTSAADKLEASTYRIRCH
jgi:uncharacterized protein